MVPIEVRSMTEHKCWEGSDRIFWENDVGKAQIAYSKTTVDMWTQREHHGRSVSES